MQHLQHLQHLYLKHLLHLQLLQQLQHLLYIKHLQHLEHLRHMQHLLYLQHLNAITQVYSSAFLYSFIFRSVLVRHAEKGFVVHGQPHLNLRQGPNSSKGSHLAVNCFVVEGEGFLAKCTAYLIFGA